MACAFLLDPTTRTVTACNPDRVDALTDRIGQAHYDVTFCIEDSDYKLVEYSATLSPYEHTMEMFELSCASYHGLAILVVHTAAKLTPDQIPVAF